MIYIHKGDSTVFANVDKFLTFNIITQLELSDWTATFQLGSITKTIDDITSKSFEVVLTAQDTSNLLYGETFGSLKLTDNNGNIKTIINTIPFCITNEVIESQFEILDLTIPETAGVEIALSVGVPTGGGSVFSVNGKIGNVVLTAKDVGALPNTTVIPNISNLATKGELEENVEELNSLIDGKQDKGDYALKSDVPTKTSELVNDSSFCYVKDVPTLVSQLENDSNYATQTQVMQAIAAIPQFALSIVNELPATGEKMVLYLVPKEGTEQDIYNEYIWIEQTSSFEFIGTTAVDLTDYVKNTDYPTTTTAGVVKIAPAASTGMSLDSNNYLKISRALESEIDTKTNVFKPIVPSNLDYAVKSGITNNANTLTDAEKTTAQTWLGLDDVVRDTDYATSSKAGIMRPANGLFTSGNTGALLISKASTAMIDAKTDNYYPIVSSNLNYAVNSVLPTMTQGEYEALATKDSDLFYMIVEE